MSTIVIVGAQWGDEGKGKLTDYLTQEADAVVRYQGGNNAGHTIVVGDSTHKFHLIPSGILHKGRLCVLSNGVVIDPDQLLREMDALQEQGIDITRLRVSDQAHYILPTHQWIDKRSEESKGQKERIGTTGRGIGPAYRDKIHRSGIRMIDPKYPDFLRQRVTAHFHEHQHALEGCEWTVDSVVEHLIKAYNRLKTYICSTPHLINEMLDDGKKLLLEGAQGTLLDIDHGTYPFVTSSNPTAGGACSGAGIGPTRINAVLGIAKAYATRVGFGPFPTEIDNSIGEQLRKQGAEFGTTTGRARRCGWLDLVALRYAVRINGLTHLALTKLDVLNAFEEIKVCTAYRIDGEIHQNYPTDANAIQNVEPIYQTLPGWQSELAHCSLQDAPQAAKDYLAFLEEHLKIPIALISFSPERNATWVKHDIWAATKS